MDNLVYRETTEVESSAQKRHLRSDSVTSLVTKNSLQLPEELPPLLRCVAFDLSLGPLKQVSPSMHTVVAFTNILMDI